MSKQIKDTLTENIVGVVPIGEIHSWDPKFNPNNYDVDSVMQKALEYGSEGWIVNLISNQFYNNRLRAEQEKSLKYFLGENDIKSESSTSYSFNQLTGLYYETNSENKVISLPIHKNIIKELSSYAKGNKPIKIKIDGKEDKKEKINNSINELSNKWNNFDLLTKELLEDYFLFGFAGVRFRPFNKKGFDGTEKWIPKLDRLEPMNTFAFTFGRLTNSLNDADCVVTYNIKVDDSVTTTEVEITTNKALYTINYTTKLIDGVKKNDNFTYVRTPLWVKSSEEVNFIEKPFIFMDTDKYAQIIFSDYKDLIDKKDELINKVVDDSIYHDESLLFIKNSGMSDTVRTQIESDLAKLSKSKETNGKKNYRAIYADNNDADVKNLDNELPTEHTKLTFEILDKNILDTSGIIDYNSDDTNENYNAIKKKYNKILNKIIPVREKYKNLVVGLLNFYSVFLREVDKETESKNILKAIEESLIVIEFDNSFLINELDQTTAIATAVSGGFLSIETASEKSVLAASDESERLLNPKIETQSSIDSKEKEFSGKREGGTTSGDLRQSQKNKDIKK